MTSALRSFLRYARYQDFIRSDLAACVPCVADWSVASIPKGLPIEHVIGYKNEFNGLPPGEMKRRITRRTTIVEVSGWYARILQHEN